MVYLIVLLIVFFFCFLAFFMFGIGFSTLFFLCVLLAGVCFSFYGLFSFFQKNFAQNKLDKATRDGETPVQDSNAEFGAAKEQTGLSALSSKKLPNLDLLPIVNTLSEQGNLLMDRFFVRGLIVAAITLALLVPLAFLAEMVDERASMRYAAIDSIERSWGGVQRISGPLLIIPYQYKYSYSEIVKDKDGNNVSVTKTAYAWNNKIVLPAKVNFNAVLSPQKRYRSIYEHVVYSTPIQIDGTFRLPTAESFGEDAVRINWRKAWFAIGIADLKGITSETPLVWAGTKLGSYHPGTGVKNLIGPGFQAEVPLSGANSGEEQTFSLSVSVNGSGGLYFTPVGETTKINVSGNWPHPSFSGDLLPTSRTITDKDFKGEWIIPHLSRTYPQSGIFGKEFFEENSKSILSFTAGINLFETVSLYSQAKRAVKYGILFIGLTFVALFAFELVTRVRMHFLQYGLVGISMTIFYLVLLSLAEHTGFLASFTAASVITVLMNSLYIAAAQKSWIKGIIMAILLSGLYTLLYTLLRMEDYALLIGTTIVLIALGVLMFLTRNLPVQGGGESPAKISAETSEVEKMA